MTGRALLAAALLALPAGAAGQGTATVSGRVLKLGSRDTVPVPGAAVVLHRVARDSQGPVDSITAGPAGQFRFRYRVDTSAVYLLSSGFAGIEYFSTPLHLDPAAPDTGLLLLVSDTASGLPIDVISRHLVISQPVADGTRPALEIAVLGNPGAVTRVAGDSSHPTWAARLPEGALGAQMGRGDVSPGSAVFRNDSLLLFAPLAPGQKELIFSYSLPARPGRMTLPLGDGAASFTLLLEERTLAVSGAGLALADTQQIEGRTFQRWTGAAEPGSTLTIGFGGGATRWLLPILVSGVAAALLLVMIRVLRRPVAAPRPAASPLLDQLARLDARYAGREGQVPEDEWRRYQDERSALKAALEQELAGRQAAP